MNDSDDEWDLQAVVRSCNTISADAATGSNTTTTIDEYDDEFDVMGSVPCSNAMNPFSYSTCSENASEGLNEVYKEGCSQRLTVAAAATTTAQLSVGDETLHEMLNACDSTSTDTPSRKRKNQQKKMVVELTQEELCSDTWAWRKYGQKPIKGSPFPRNYYKCSTTKACGARKQVEQSHMDPTIFIVSYSGEHIHPPPTHRSPLAGSTRSTKFAMPNVPSVSEDATQS